MLGEFIKRNKILLGKLLAAFLAFGLGLTIFALIADEVHEGATTAFDSAILLWINARGNPGFDWFFIHITDLGGVTFLAILSVIITAFLIYKKSYYRALLMLAAVGGAAMMNLILKSIFERTRPDLWTHLVTEDNFSFPSGHAMGSSAFAFAIIAILWGTKWQPLAIGLGIIYIFFIGFSRLYLGVHFPTDIIAGWALSLAWVSVVTGLVYTRVYRSRQRKLAEVEQL